MFKKASATESRTNTHRGKVVSTDPDLAKREFQKRRPITLEQVRQQSKDIAEDVRNKVRKGKTKQLYRLENQQYQECLKDIGFDHIQATIEEESDEAFETEKEGHDYVAQQRGERTIKGLQKQKKQKQLSKSTSFLRKKYVHKVEKARSAYVVNLNKKKCNSTFKKKKRKGVLGATGSPSRLCKGSASESEITELLEFFSSNSSSKSSTPKIALTEKYPSHELQHVRGDYNRLSENADEEKLTMQYVLPLPRQEHVPEIFITYPLDTQTSARIKRRTLKNAFNEPVRNICDNVIRDGNTKKKTRREGPIKLPTKKHYQPEHLNKKTNSNSEQSMHDLIKNYDKQIPTKPRESSRTAPAKRSKRETSATSKQCYDHKNRYFKKYMPSKADFENIDVCDCTDSETEFVERIYQRDSDAKLRGSKAFKQLTENRPKELQQKRQKVLDFDKKEKSITNILLKNIDSDLIREAARKVAVMPVDENVLSQRRENLLNMLSSLPVGSHLHNFFDGFENINVSETATKKSSISNQQQRSRIRCKTDRTSELQNVKALSSSLSPCYRINKFSHNFANEIPSWQEREGRDPKYHTSSAGSQSTKLCVCCGCAKQACEIVVNVSEKGEPEICLSPINLTDVREAVSILEASLKKPNLKMSKEKQKVTSKVSKPDKSKSGDEHKTKAVRCSNARKPKKHTYFETSELSWREQFVKNSSNSSASCYDPHTSLRAQKQLAASKQKVKTDFAHLCCGTGDASKTLNSHQYQHIKRLLMMSRGSVDELGVSSASDVSTPSSSVVNVQPNLSSSEFMKHLNLRLSNIERYVSCSPDDSHIHYNTPESTISFKSDPQVHTPRDARQMALEEYTAENYPGILRAYNKLAENCVKKIENLAAMIEKVQLDKLSVLQSPMSPSDKREANEYMEMSTKYKQQKSLDEHKVSQSDAEQEELDRQLLEIDYRFAEQLKKMTPAAVAEEQQDTVNIELMQLYKNLLADNKQQKQAVRRMKQGLQPATLKMVSDNSASELENIESVLTEMGMGWAVATLRKTQESLALSSSSNSSVDIGVKQKEINQTGSGGVSYKDTLKRDIFSKLSTSSTATDDTSTFSPFSNEFRNINQDSSVRQEKALLRTSTPTQSSRLTDHISRNDTQPRITTTGESGLFSEKYSYDNVDGTRFYRLKEEPSIKSGITSSNTVEFQNTSAFQGSPMNQGNANFQTASTIQNGNLTNDRSRNYTQPRIIITGEASPMWQEGTTLQTSTPEGSSSWPDNKSNIYREPRIALTGKSEVSPFYSLKEQSSGTGGSTSSYLVDDISKNDAQPRYAITSEGSSIGQEETTLRTSTPIQSSYSTDYKGRNDTQPRIIVTGEGLSLRQEETTLRPSTSIGSNKSGDDKSKNIYQPYITTTREAPWMRQEEADWRTSTPIQGSKLADDKSKNIYQPHITTTGEAPSMRQEEADWRTSTPIQGSKFADDKSKNIYQPHITTTGEAPWMRQEEADWRTSTPIQGSKFADDKSKNIYQPHIITTGEAPWMRQEEADWRTSTPIQGSKLADDISKNIYQPHITATGEAPSMRQEKADMRTFTPIQRSKLADDKSKNIYQPHITATGEAPSIRQEEAALRTFTPIQRSKLADDKSKNIYQPRITSTGEAPSIRQEEADLRTFTPIQRSKLADDKSKNIYQPRITSTGEAPSMRQEKADMRTFTPIQRSKLADDKSKNVYQPPLITSTGDAPSMRQEKADMRTSTPKQRSKLADDKTKNIYQPLITSTGEAPSMRQEKADMRTSTPKQRSKLADDKSKNIYQPHITTKGEAPSMRQEKADLRAFTHKQRSKLADDKSKNIYQPHITTKDEDALMRLAKPSSTPIQSSKLADDKSKNIYQPPLITSTGETPSMRQEKADLRTSTPIQRSKLADDKSKNIYRPDITTTGEASSMRQEKATMRTSTPTQSSKLADDKSKNIYPPHKTTAGEALPMRQEKATLQTSSPIQSSKSTGVKSKNIYQPGITKAGDEKATLRTSTPIQSSKSTDDKSKNIYQPHITTKGEAPSLRQEKADLRTLTHEKATLRTSTPIQSSKSIDDKSKNIYQPGIAITGDEKARLRTSTSIQSSKSTDDKSKNFDKKRNTITSEGISMRQEEATLETPTPTGNSSKPKFYPQARITITGKSEVSPFYSLKKQSSSSSGSTSESTTSESTTSTALT